MNLKKYRYVLMAFVLTGIVTGLLFQVGDLLDNAILVLVYLFPVAVSGVLWGLWPAITAAVVAFLSFNYFFIEPTYTFMIHKTQDVIILFTFLGMAVAFSQMVGRLRDSLAKTTAREQEAVHLAEFGYQLSRSSHEDEILNGLCQNCIDLCQADCVEIFLEQDRMFPEKYINCLKPGMPQDIFHSFPHFLISMQGSQKMLGEIRLWKVREAFSEAEQRLVKAFASQTVLALERSRLVQVELRTQVLEESDRLKSSLLSSVSHELRTPLSTIKASVSSLRMEVVEWDSADRSELLAAIEEETDHLNQLVGNLLNMSRIEAGGLHLEYQWNILRDIVAEAIRKTDSGKSKERVVIDIPDELPLVSCDAVLMQQVFVNLLSNSIKYSPENSKIRITIRLENPQTVWVQVSNQGAQVPQSDLEGIFEKFHRITDTDRVTGTGLGLSICKGIVEAHHGKIWAKNLPHEPGDPYQFAIEFVIPIHREGLSPLIPTG